MANCRRDHLRRFDLAIYDRFWGISRFVVATFDQLPGNDGCRKTIVSRRSPDCDIKGGTSHPETDEIGYRAAIDPVTVHDLHAIMVHLLGIDHKQLTYLHNGRHYRLTDVAGNVLANILS